MAKDVLEALQEIIAEFGFAGDRSEAAAYIKEMKTRQRYLQDIWS
jgi:sulfite reductase alpha subunit-like flavoprotein